MNVHPEVALFGDDRGRGAESSRLGGLLLAAGSIDDGRLRQALDIQNSEWIESRQPMGTMMFRNKVITAEQLDLLLHHPDLRRPIGAMAVEAGLIGPRDLETCLRLKRPAEPTGGVMLRCGHIDQKQLALLLRTQAAAVRTGELALNLGQITETELDRMVRLKNGPRLIGEILCDLNYIGLREIKQALSRQDGRPRLGEILKARGLASDEQIQRALREKERANLRLGRVLVGHRVLDEEQLTAVLSLRCNLPFRSLRGFRFDAREGRLLGSLVAESLAREHLLLPLSLRGRTLSVGLADPEQEGGFEALCALHPGLNIEPALIPERRYAALFDQLYRPAAAGVRPSNRCELVLTDLNPSETASPPAPAFPGARDAPGVEPVVDFILRFGIHLGASDIHLEQEHHGCRLRYRVDGICRDMETAWLNRCLPEMSKAIISRIKVLSGLDIAERRLPQDGVFRACYHDRKGGLRHDLDFRVATCPAIAGENVSIRILDPRKTQAGLDNLGHSDHVLSPLKRLFRSSAGMLLVSGPTGSGKTSTLYAALNHIHHPGIRIITAEDPIEYSIPGIMQTQIKPKIGLNFARLLRSFLRLDPDVILVGEIRDPETAAMAFDAAQTGHLLLSTLHTNDAVSALPRLLDLGIEPGQIGASLIGVLAQRLVRRLCEHCKRPYLPPRTQWELFFETLPDDLVFYRGVGCSRCGYSGYSGRTLISELLEPDHEICLSLNRGLDKAELVGLALRGGMKTMIDDGLGKLNQTTLSEILRVAPVDTVREFSSRRAAAQYPGKQNGRDCYAP